MIKKAKYSTYIVFDMCNSFYQDFYAKALVLVNPTLLEIFQRDLVAKALVLVNPTVLEIFQ